MKVKDLKSKLSVLKDDKELSPDMTVRQIMLASMIEERKTGGAR